MDEGNASKRARKDEMAALLELPVTANDDEIQRAFRAEVKRLHPDAGGGRTAADIERLEVLLAARDRWWHEPGERSSGVPADVEAAAPWFTPEPSGPVPRPGFWAGRRKPDSRG